MVSGRRKLRRALGTLPVSEGDRQAVDRRVDFYQDWLAHDVPGDPWWDAVDCSSSLESAPPCSLVGGWYDPFLPEQVANYERMQAAGRTVRLTIGPWTHASPGCMAASLRDGLEWFDFFAREPHPPPRRDPVRVFVTGSRRWVGLPGWPPRADLQHWHLHAGGRLDTATPGAEGPDRYRYDPADPTPSIGGAALDWRTAGSKDQRDRELRPDVLTYSGPTLEDDLTVIGPLAVDLSLRSSVDHTDVFVRLCDVSPKGRSMNLSDGIRRLRPSSFERAGDGTFRLRIAMWPAAHTFRRGHRIRLQVSGGGHPLFVRNTGTDEPLAGATTLRRADHEVLHDTEHPSVVWLPVSEL